uniref:Protein kinase domain-containing protein n=1 Tax=viral metagenome TaxID=1070528 RepID=A0A6C0F810_9ZZZZ
MFRYLSYLYNYGNLLRGLHDIYVGKTNTDDIPEKMIPLIQNCGSVAIKFCQWALPKLELLLMSETDIYNRNMPVWIRKLEMFFENCPEHSIEYTKQLYKSEYGEEFDKTYTVIETLGSGSIGQVYLVKDNLTQEKYVLKIQHPGVKEEINFVWLFFSIIKYLPCLQRFRKQYPFRFEDFMESFYMQIDFVNEAQNALRMKQKYVNNPYVQIPDIYRFTNKTLIMEYIPGKTLEECELSNYDKHKLYTILLLFVRSNILLYNFNHGDIHKGNWKISGKMKIVLYDFGFCWSLPDDMVELADIACSTFEKHTSDYLDDVVELMYVLLDKPSSTDICVLRKQVNEYVYHSDYLGIERGNKNVPVSPIKIIKSLCEFCDSYPETLHINKYLLQFLILFIQLHRSCVYFGFTSPENTTIDTNKTYREKYKDMLNFCETYKVFPEYMVYAKDKLSVLDYKPQTIFDTIELSDNLKQLALNLKYE